MFLEIKRDGETIAKPTKADPFKRETLIAWLEKQPAMASYCYIDSGECLLAQYFIETLDAKITVGPWDVHWGRGFYYQRDLPLDFQVIAKGEKHTFGAALARARELAAHAEGRAE